MRRTLFSLALVGALIGIPALVLQRWVAETRFAAMVLVLAWFATVGVGLVVYVWRRPRLRAPVLGAFVGILGGTVAIGYLTGFRDMVVDEDVAMAVERAPAAARSPARTGTPEPASRRSSASRAATVC